ncbi:hypothetical protein I2485_11465 [Nesterenkonia sp. E16_7]|uniref:DUF4190 domain-containing protein n=1 Tax=unclassified Nesterenkonia TaxID=2629769 RepID=UPI001A924B55|nr:MULTISPECIES: DUF4190 domain-containing protein [unclassified Nesterenkonia]MBO0596138.1 hypothetical protein [Nesterenkonia sp. E16_10]MBO0599258.1 hypothetical protein [Nesterenkonia sp. E16_7]
MSDHYAQNPQQPQQYDQQQHHPMMTAAPPRKGIGIAAMVLGIVAIVFAFIPVIGLANFILAPLAVILGIVAFVKRRGRGQGITGVITGAIALLITIIGVAIAGAIFSSVDDDMRELEEEAQSVDPADDEEVAELEEDIQDEQEDIAEDREEPEAAGTGGDEGSRENPLPIGEPVSHDDWEVTINSVTPNADDAIAAENQFNDPAPEGQSYMLVNMTATYLGDESDSPMMATEVAYVSSTGETSSDYELSAVAPDSFDSIAELYNGGSETGNISLAVPNDDDGTLRVRIGFFDTQDFFFEAS